MKTLVKSLITFVFLYGLALPNLAQTRQTQAILNAWDSEVTTDIFADTITSDIKYSDTICVDRWSGSPRETFLYLQIDSTEFTDDVTMWVTPEYALSLTGPFYTRETNMAAAMRMPTSFSSVGCKVTYVSHHGAKAIRFAFSCSDTLYLHATLWMKH